MLQDKWFPRTRTSVVESELRQLAVNIGVIIHYNTNVNIMDILNGDAATRETSESAPDVIICCDGARSISRKRLIEYQTRNGDIEASGGKETNMSPSIAEFRDEKELGSLLQVKFEAHGNIQRSKGVLDPVVQNLPADKQFFSILPGNFDSIKCTTPVTVFALLNKTVRSVISKPPVHADHQENEINADVDPGAADFSERSASDSSINSEILLELETVLARVCPAGIVNGSIKVSTLPVSYKVSSQVSFKVGETFIFLAGDAAMGLPLEKGLNYGWRISGRLAKYVSFCDNVDQAQSSYEKYFSAVASEAIVSVNKAYAEYIYLLAKASIARSILKPLLYFSSSGTSSSAAITSGCDFVSGNSTSLLSSRSTCHHDASK